jgi:hypothetical protein
VAEETILDVRGLQRFAKKGIRAQINHSHGKIIAGAPVSVNFI